MFYEPCFFHNFSDFSLNMRLLRCDDCKAWNRVITYSIQKKALSHVFLIRRVYTEPDCCAILWYYPVEYLVTRGYHDMTQSFVIWQYDTQWGHSFSYNSCYKDSCAGGSRDCEHNPPCWSACAYLGKLTERIWLKPNYDWI